MSYDLDDPRLTAYALDQLAGDERAEFEVLLAEHPELQAEVDAIRAAAAELSAALAAEPVPQFAPVPVQPRRPRRLTWALALAACLAMAFGLYHWLLPAADVGGPQFAQRPAPVAAGPSAIEKRIDRDVVKGKSKIAVPSPDGEVAQSDNAWINVQYVDGHLNVPAEQRESTPTTEVPGLPTIVVGSTESSVQTHTYAVTFHGTDDGVSGAAAASPPHRARPAIVAPVAKLSLADVSEESVLVREAADEGWNREAYDHIADNAFRAVTDHPLSTFSIDVDTASYANMRRFLSGGQLPPKDAVRIEELVNYFGYEYPPPEADDPFSVGIEVVSCPWQQEHRLARIGLKGRTFDSQAAPPCNLVFLIDVSGSMSPANKLPLLKQSLQLLAERLRPCDRVAMAVYAGAAGLVLPSTSGDEKATIVGALDRLKSGGSTNGGAGIELAYQVAAENFIQDGVNRVILATDGDFNVGTTSKGDLTRLIEAKAKSGVFLTVLGFGMGNYQDARLEQLADKGNGNYGYIDTLAEARKLLVEQLSGTLVAIAKDVKIQIEFNPARVQAYRLIGYENRRLNKEDFNDDTKDAGEIGAGHTVTALYELVPAGVAVATPKVDPLRYREAPPRPDATLADESFIVKLRYKAPDGDRSELISLPFKDDGRSYAAGTTDMKFAAGVAAFGMLLRDSLDKGNTSYDAVLELAGEGASHDPNGYRAEFLQLVAKAKALSERAE